MGLRKEADKFFKEDYPIINIMEETRKEHESIHTSIYFLGFLAGYSYAFKQISQWKRKKKKTN